MSAARDREHDEWIPWYVEDTPGWLELSLAARGAMEGIARKLNRKTGQLTLRRGLSSLAVLLHVQWAELQPAVEELIARGKVCWDISTFQLSDPEYVERKRRSGADRMADSRARRRDVTDVAPVTSLLSLPSQASPVTDVTPVLVSSDLISSGSDLGSDARPSPTVVPDWWAGTCDATAMVIGGDVEARPSLWVRYLASRERKVWSMGHTDAVGWITDVVTRERRETRDRRDRDAGFKAERQALLPKAPAPQDSRKTFKERDAWVTEAGAPDPEAQARLNKLLGKVGT